LKTKPKTGQSTFEVLYACFFKTGQSTFVLVAYFSKISTHFEKQTMHTSGPLRLAADVFRRRASQVAPTTCPRRMSRTHARTGGRRANGAARLPLCRSASRFKLAVQSSAFDWRTDGRSAYDRTQTVAAACNPLGATPIVSHSRKEGTFARPNACFRCGLVPLIPTPVSARRTLPCVCRARRRREPCSPTSLAWRCCEPERACVCRERSAAAKSHSMKRKNRRRPRTDARSLRSPCSSSRCSD
jgi:hypothetical protein